MPIGRENDDRTFGTQLNTVAILLNSYGRIRKYICDPVIVIDWDGCGAL